MPIILRRTDDEALLDPANEEDLQPIKFSEPDANDDVKPDELSGVVATADNLQFKQWLEFVPLTIQACSAYLFFFSTSFSLTLLVFFRTGILLLC